MSRKSKLSPEQIREKADYRSVDRAVVVLAGARSGNDADTRCFFKGTNQLADSTTLLTRVFIVLLSILLRADCA